MALSRQRDLSEPAKDNIRSRIASTIQSASITDSNLTKDEQQALKRLKNDKNIVILPADKGRVTVVMDKTGPYKVRGSEACEAPCEACEACEAHKK